jgi:CHAT domain-containing protein/Tfp pilus assembly protein PilF
MRTISTIAILCIFNIIVFSNNQDSIEIRKSLDEAIEFQKKFKPRESLSILNNLLARTKERYGLQSKQMASLHYHIANAKLDLAEYDEAKKLLDQALQVFKLIDSVSVELGDTYMLLGIYYDYIADYDKALAYYDLTKSIYLKLFPLNDFRFGYLYNNMGICIYYKGDIERALTFFNKSLAITIENFGTQNEELSKELNNISFCYTALKKTASSKKTLRLSWQIANQNKLLDSPRGARILHALGLAYFELADFDNAIINFEAAYKLRLKHLPKIHTEIASNYFMLANIYVEIEKATEAKIYFKKALEIYTALYDKPHPDIAIAHTKLAAILFKEKKLEAALIHINNAISIFNYDGNIPITENDNFDLNILAALDTKAQIHHDLWKKNKNVLQLKKADRVYGDLIYILNEFRKGFKEELSKEILANDFFHVFDNAIETSYSLFEATQQEQFLKVAFERFEYSSSFVLLEERRNTKAKNIAEIPDSLLQIEQKLNLDITSLEKKKRDEEQKEDKDQNTISTLSSHIFDLKEELYKLIRKFETDYPRYFHFKYDMSIVSVDKLQNKTLDADQTLVEYFVGEKNIFVFVITKDLFKVEKIEKKFPLEFWVTELRKKITAFQFPFNLNDDYHERLVQYSEALYWELIAPVEKYFKERITIVPGGILAEIPFECLIKQTGSSNTKYKEHVYLLQDYAISYCYSGTLLDEMVDNRKTNANHEMIAFAPSFNSFGKSSNLRDLLLLPLQFNTSEVKDITNIMDGKSVLGNEATEDYFINQSNQYSILHFASHAKADNINGDYSFLAFSEVYDTLENELLYVKDIYNLQLQSEMVTLSACQTGVGENRKGEGVISLSRSFSFAGTGNINTSLWNVSDAKTAKLMKLFYQNISDGNTKDQALRKAKLNFISSNSDNMQVHPFFWTAMISIGDMHSIQISKQPNILLLIFTLMGLSCFIWWSYQRFKNSSVQS